MNRVTVRLGAALAVLAIVAGACSSGDDSSSPDNTSDPRRGECITVDAAVSSEKIQLLGDLAESFNDSGATVDGKCIYVEVQKKASGAATTALAEGWDDRGGRPRARHLVPGRQLLGPDPEPAPGGRGQAGHGARGPHAVHAHAAGDRHAGADGRRRWATRTSPSAGTTSSTLARSQTGWADYGHPEWGQFKLGKTNPNYSTSGLSALIAQTYAATGKTAGLSSEDLDQPGRGAVRPGHRVLGGALRRHHHDVPQQLVPGRPTGHGAHLRLRGGGRGEVGHRLQRRQPRRRARPGRGAPQAPHPAGGHLPDRGHPLLGQPVLHPRRRLGQRPSSATAAEQFQAFVQEPENQEKVLEFGFRPGNPEVEVGDPIVAANGVDPNQPQTLLEVPVRPGDDRPARQVGPAAQGRPGA